MNSSSYSNQDLNAPESSGIGDYIALLKRRRYLLLGVALPIIALGAMFAVGLPNVYRSTGLVEIEDAQQNMKTMIARDSVESPYADQYVQRLGTVVLSDANLAKLLSEHEFYTDQKEDPKAAIQKLRKAIGVDIVTVPILDPQSGREREVVTAFTVAYDNADPQHAQQGAAWLVKAYLEENRRDRARQVSSAARFFGEEAERIRTHVVDLETKQAEFKRQNVGQLPEQATANLGVMERTENEIQNLESQMQALRRERVFLVSQLQQAREAAGPETNNLRQLEDEYRRKSTQYDQSHPDLVSLRRQIDTLRRGGSTSGMSLQAQLQNQRAMLSETQQRYSEDHPDVKRMKRDIAALEARIAAGDTADRSISADSPMAMQVQTQLNATDTQLGALQTRSAELRAKVADLETKLSLAPQVEREFQNVSRDLASARAKYDELLRRQMDAEVSEAAIAGGTADKFRMTSAPTIPAAPSKPQRPAIFIIALVLGVMAGLTAAIGAQFLDRTVRGTRDVRDLLSVAPLAVVPVIDNSRSSGLRKRHALLFAAKTVVAVIVVYYAASQFII